MKQFIQVGQFSEGCNHGWRFWLFASLLFSQSATGGVLLDQKVGFLQSVNEYPRISKNRLNTSLVFCEKRCSQKFYEIHRKALVSLLKKIPWHRCFPVNFVKFLRSSFFTDYLRTTASFICANLCRFTFIALYYFPRILKWVLGKYENSNYCLLGKIFKKQEKLIVCKFVIWLFF